MRFAPVALKEAEGTLELSHRLWEAKADKIDVEHHAYLAKQKTAIARETAMLNAAQHEIGQAETELATRVDELEALRTERGLVLT